MDSRAPRLSGLHALSLTSIAATRRPDKPAPTRDRAIPVGAGLPAMDSRTPRLSGLRALSLTSIAGKPAPTIGNRPRNTCRSRLAGDGLKGTAVTQFARVFVNDHREQARSYRGGGVFESKKSPATECDAGQKNWLVAANQRSSLKNRYLLATVSGCQPPPRAL